MKHEVLAGMSAADLDSYAQLLGINVKVKKTVASKVAVIEAARGRAADIEVFGHTFTVLKKSLHDKRVTDLVGKNPLTDEDAFSLLRLLLGESQLEKLFELVTDDDGTVDNEAIALAMATILGSEELKNF